MAGIFPAIFFAGNAMPPFNEVSMRFIRA